MKINRITSKDNPVIKRLLRAARRDEIVPVEGPKLLAEALASGFSISSVTILGEKLAEYEKLLNQSSRSGSRIIVVPTNLLARLSDTVTHQGIIGFCEPKFETNLPTVDAHGGPLVLLDAIQDPGNVGAILRSALAFSAAGVVLLAGCANPFSSKAVRASAGASFKVKLIKSNYDQFLRHLSDTGMKAYALERGGKITVWDADLDRNCAIIVGNEGSGINPVLLNSVKQSLSVPVDPQLESLNAAVAVSVVLYEIARGGREGKSE